MQRDEVSISWSAGGHTFKLTASLSDETLTVQLSMPRDFLSGADDAQRRDYGAARDRALLELADALHRQHEGEDHHHPIHRH